MNNIENVLKIRKWEWVPIIGTLIYAVRIENFRQKIEDKQVRKTFGHYRTIFTLITFCIALVFLILFLVFRHKHGFGAFPWFFWVGLAFGLFSNLTSIFPLLMYQAGWKKAQKILTARKDEPVETKEEK